MLRCACSPELRSSSPFFQRSTSGITLIELMVAMTVFLMLGGALVMFLNTGIRTWRVGEARREAFERAQAILETLADDLSSTFPDPSHGTHGEVDVIFLSDYDDQGRQRLRFVRTLAGEMRHPITQDAGSLTGGLGEYDYMDDALEVKQCTTHLCIMVGVCVAEVGYKGVNNHERIRLFFKSFSNELDFIVRALL